MSIISIICYTFKNYCKDIKYRFLISIVIIVCLYQVSVGLVFCFEEDHYSSVIKSKAKYDLSEIYYIDAYKQIEFSNGDKYVKGQETYDFVDMIRRNKEIDFGGFVGEQVFSEEGDYLFDIYYVDDDFLKLFKLVDEKGEDISSIPQNEVYIGNNLYKKDAMTKGIIVYGKEFTIKGILQKNSSFVTFNTSIFENLNLDSAVVINSSMFQLVEGCGEDVYDYNALQHLYFHSQDDSYAEHLNIEVAERGLKINSIRNLLNLKKIARSNSFEENKGTFILTFVTMIVSLFIVYIVNLIIVDKNQKKYWIMKMNGMTQVDIYGIFCFESILNALPALCVSIYAIMHDYTESFGTGDDVYIAKRTGITFVAVFIFLWICSFVSSVAILKYRNSRINHGG